MNAINTNNAATTTNQNVHADRYAGKVPGRVRITQAEERLTGPLAAALEEDLIALTGDSSLTVTIKRDSGRQYARVLYVIEIENNDGATRHGGLTVEGAGAFMAGISAARSWFAHVSNNGQDGADDTVVAMTPVSEATEAVSEETEVTGEAVDETTTLEPAPADTATDDVPPLAA